MEKNARRWTTYAGYLISGAAVGAVLGVLFAPKPGRETREQMNGWIKDRREKGRVAYRAMKDALESRRRAFRAKAKEIAGV